MIGLGYRPDIGVFWLFWLSSYFGYLVILVILVILHSLFLNKFIIMYRTGGSEK